MDANIDVIAKLVSPLVTLLGGAIVKRVTEQRSNLISYIGHVSSFPMQDEARTIIFTHSIILKNLGKKAATNVRVGHNIFPRDFNVFPKVNYSLETNPEGAVEIVFPTLVPTEQITISYLYFPPVIWDQINTFTKSDDGFAKIINAIPMPQPPKWVITLVWVLMFFGATSIVYWLIRLIPHAL